MVFMNKEERNLEQRIKDHFDVAMEKVEDKFDLLYEGQKDLKEKFYLVADDIDVVKSDVVDIKRDIKEMKVELKMKANKEVVENYENRLIELENKALAK